MRRKKAIHFVFTALVNAQKPEHRKAIVKRRCAPKASAPNKKGANPKTDRKRVAATAEMVKQHSQNGLGKAKIGQAIGIPEGEVSYILKKLKDNGGKVDPGARER